MVPKWGTGELTGVQTLPATANRAVLKVTLDLGPARRGRRRDRQGQDRQAHRRLLDAPHVAESLAAGPVEPVAVAVPEPVQCVAVAERVGHAPSSTTPDPSQSATAPPPSDEPEFVYDQTCDTLTVGVDNPATGVPETVTFTPSVGEPKTVTAAPGEVKTVDFPASEGLTVEAVPQSAPDEAATITYQAPADCDDSGSGSGGGLPVTGAAIGGIAGGAALLLAVGVALFVMARRRKVKFTA